MSVEEISLNSAICILTLWLGDISGYLFALGFRWVHNSPSAPFAQNT
jgi:hypothetical protein